MVLGLAEASLDFVFEGGCTSIQGKHKKQERNKKNMFLFLWLSSYRKTFVVVLLFRLQDSQHSEDSEDTGVLDVGTTLHPSLCKLIV